MNQENVEIQELLESVVNELFSAAREREISYCILRNYSSLPESTLGGDIDLLVDPSMIKRWDNLMQDIAANFGMALGIIQAHYHGNRYCISCVEKRFFLKLDVHYGEYWRGAEYLNVRDMLDSRIEYKGFYVPSLVNEALLSLLDPLITGGKSKQRYEGLITNVAQLHRNEFLERLTVILGNSLARDVVNLICRDQFSSISKMSSKIRVQLWLRMFTSSFFRGRSNILKYLAYETGRRVSPLGYLIVLEGEDNEILKFTELFRSTTETYFPGLSVNSDNVKRTSFVNPSKSLKSYNAVICDSRSQDDNRYEVTLRKTPNQVRVLLHLDGKATVFGSLLDHSEAAMELHSLLLKVYIENYNEIELKQAI